ncbi:MAG: alpha-glucan family phosphorylase [bacterium]
MNRLHTLNVIPTLPEKLERLREIAMDLHWTWHPDAVELFERLDPELWVESDQNPLCMLAAIGQDRLEELVKDEGFMDHLEGVWQDFQDYREEKAWFSQQHKDTSNLLVAYFSSEFGLHECLPIYSGGLGVLAGDHLKAASDLGVPLVGVGLLYQRGYFRQYLNADGWQQENYPSSELFCMPVELMRDGEGNPLADRVLIGTRDVEIHVWRAMVGRVELFLLDTNVFTNHPDDRQITEALYGGDTEMRIRQEILLGIGGVRMLKALGKQATVFHMNEGHSAFLALERIRALMAEEKLTFAEAREAIRAFTVFTTHTPVPAGIDKFGQDQMYKYFKEFMPQIGLDKESFMELGGVPRGKSDAPFNMAILAIGLSAFVNGVSKLHGEVSRKMWSDRWPLVSAEEVPIHHVTNGVHARSWVSAEMSHLYDRYIGKRWQEDPRDHELWERVERIPDEELWRSRERMRERLVIFARSRVKKQFERRGEPLSSIELAKNLLDMKALTIGFARRFATYKRGSLLIQDPERLIRLLNNPERPVQLIFAGKAHPKDDPGKEMIREIIHFARDDRIRDRIVFLEDYDMNVARHLVQGCDVWLNTPRPPMEASGTSGMKAAVNGVLNCSTFDGWWVEGYDAEVGWKIGNGEMYNDLEVQDKIESELLYDLLEKEIIPLFYSSRGRIPLEWTATIKRMLARQCPFFITTRMVSDYSSQAYVPCHERALHLAENGYVRAKNLSSWQERIRGLWSGVEVVEVRGDGQQQLNVGDRVRVQARVRLGELDPSEVQVMAWHGNLGGERTITHAHSIPLAHMGVADDKVHEYEGHVECTDAGQFGYAVRVLPYHEDLNNPLDLGLVTWE